MSKIINCAPRQGVFVGVMILTASVIPSSHKTTNKILGGYFEESSIYYAATCA